jgi:uncharacterized membrane protein YgaE (UPF0421/DUF939 family)
MSPVHDRRPNPSPASSDLRSVDTNALSRHADIAMTFRTLTLRSTARSRIRRVRPHLLPIVQTAAAAVAAYYVALLLPLADSRPVFASIAAVIALGATYSRRGARAAELVGGVVVGLTVADLIVQAIGTGPLQIGLMIVLAMGAAVALGGGELLISEAAVSALLLASLEPNSHGFTPDRFIEALTGGAVALVVSSVLFPPDPALVAGRAAQRVFADLGRTLQELARALADGDADRAERALRIAGRLDGGIDAFDEALGTAREAARLAPPRRAARDLLERYTRALPHLDLAARNATILARHAVRYSRSRLHAPDGLPEAVEELAQAVWTLAATPDDPRMSAEARDRAVVAAAGAREVFEREPDLVLTEIVGQVRGVAVDLMRASEVMAGSTVATDELPTEELLAAEPLRTAA